jgi:hypothetical protein
LQLFGDIGDVNGLMDACKRHKFKRIKAMLGKFILLIFTEKNLKKKEKSVFC